jgi:hypothetical protein
MKITRRISNLMFVGITALAVAIPTIAQDSTQASQAATSAQPARVAPGRKQKIEGVVLSREADKMTIRDINGSDVVVNVTGATRITEKKANPFRSARNYPVTALLRAAATAPAFWSPIRSDSPMTISAWRVHSIRASLLSKRV